MAEPETPMDLADDGESRFLEEALLALDGLLDAEGQAALRAALAGDVDKRRLFVELCLQSQAISEVLGQHSQDLAADDRARLEAIDPRLADAWDDLDFTRKIEGAGRSARSSLPSRRPWLPWTIAAAACILALLTAGSVAWRRPAGVPALPQPATPARPDRERPAGGDRPSLAAGNALAMVIKLDGVRWEPADAPPPSEGDLLAAGHLRFRSGRATLSMLTGVALVVEGPADVELVSFDKVLCHGGKLRAWVPEGAEGFVVSGPGSAVVDLGTEFGLNVESDGKTRGKVFEGQVEAMVFNAAGTSQRSQVMDESEAFEIDPRTGHIEALSGSEDFVAPGALAAPPLELGPDYPAAVLGSRPWGYWRFESMEGGAIPNEVPGRPPLRATGPIRLSDSSPDNHGAVFGPGQRGQYLEMDGLWEPAPRPGFAVELWFLPESISRSTLASMTTPKGSNLHLFMLEMTAQERANPQQRPAAVRALHRWPPGDIRCDNIFSEEPYRLYRWHHLVGQIHGDRLELFIDGAHSDSLAIDADHPAVPCQVLLGRKTTLARRRSPTSRPFVGRIDEVALYDRPLSAGEVRDHFQMATLEGRPR